MVAKICSWSSSWSFSLSSRSFLSVTSARNPCHRRLPSGSSVGDAVPSTKNRRRSGSSRRNSHLQVLSFPWLHRKTGQPLEGRRERRSGKKHPCPPGIVWAKTEIGSKGSSNAGDKIFAGGSPPHLEEQPVQVGGQAFDPPVFHFSLGDTRRAAGQKASSPSWTPFPGERLRSRSGTSFGWGVFFLRHFRHGAFASCKGMATLMLSHNLLS